MHKKGTLMIKTQLEIRKEAESIIKTNILDKNNVDINQHEDLESVYLDAKHQLAVLIGKIQDTSDEQ